MLNCEFVVDKKYGCYIQEATISTYTILGRQQIVSKGYRTGANRNA